MARPERGAPAIIAKAAKEACDIQRAELASYEQQIRGVLEEKGMVVNEVDKSDFIGSRQGEIYPMSYETIGEGDADKARDLVQRILNTK